MKKQEIDMCNGPLLSKILMFAIPLMLSSSLQLFFNAADTVVVGRFAGSESLATAISQCVAATLVIRSLIRSDGALKLNLRALHINPKIFKEIVYLGVPAGMQGILFSVSNTLIQSAINSFGASAIAGNTAAANLESFIIMCMNAFYQANLTFTSQNIGGGRYDRLNRILGTCLGIVVVVGASMGAFICAFGHPLLHIYTQDPEVVNFGMMRIMVLCSTYFLYGLTDTIVGSLRGFGYSLVPTAITLIGMCLFRVVWVFTVFQWKHSLVALYISFPASWATSLVAYVICLYIVRKKLPSERVEVQPVEA